MGKGSIRIYGDLKRTYKFLNKMATPYYMHVLERYGQQGVNALAAATPVRTGKTASSWSYRIEQTGGGASIIFENSNVVKYVNVALILQYGHGTRNGGYVEGIDYINPALAPVFEKMAKELWEEVSSS